MEYDQLLAAVQRWSGCDSATAERALHATLRALRDRCSAAVARRLGADLPAELLADVSKMGAAERFDVDEFYRRVAANEGVDLQTAEQHAQAVMHVLGTTLSREVREHLDAELPEDIRILFDRAPAMTASEFVRRVATRAGLDPAAATRATDATLEVLARRIAGGDVRDLVARLPVQLHEPLKRGEADHDRPARPVPLDEFVEEVAEREGTSVDEARRHIRAVLETLEEAVGEEYFDVRVQLPPAYASVLPRPGE